MKTRIISIGKSQGIRIPKGLLEQTGMHGIVEIYAQGNTLVIGTSRRPREGWEAALREMTKRGDDALLDSDSPSLSSWDESSWEW